MHMGVSYSLPWEVSNSSVCGEKILAPYLNPLVSYNCFCKCL